MEPTILAISRSKFVDLMIVTLAIPTVIYIANRFSLSGPYFIGLYYGAPALFLCFRAPKNYFKIVLASIVLGLLFGMTYDMVAEIQSMWRANYGDTFFSRSILGNTPLGDFMWAFLIPFYTLVFYEHFLDDEVDDRLSRNAGRALLISAIIFFAGCSAILFFERFPQIPYAYLLLGFSTVIPIGAIVKLQKTTLYKLALVSIFFLLFNFFGELAWLYAGYGTYPGQYIGYVHVWGIRIPWEEVLYWTVLSTPALVVCYEWLFDDKNNPRNPS